MKKSSLTTAVLAGLVGVAGFVGSSSAVEINPDGTGQVLIYPYYTARAGQQTYISVVNSTAAPQAVKVRFLEGYASKEVLDFNLFLSAYDVWTGTVFKLSDAGLAGDGAAIGTRDNSCTVPNFTLSTTGASPLMYQPFSNLIYTTNDPDKGPQGLDRTNEGYIELIDMADVGSTTDVNGDGLTTAQSITHIAGVPPACGAYRELNAAGAATNPDLYTDAPTGGLFGNGAIVNVAEGTYYAYNADAVDGFTIDNLFSQSGSLFPNLTFANTDTLGQAAAYVFQPGGAVVTATYPAGQTIDAVTAVFDASALLNTFIADAAHGQGTDWVVTFPTKRYYVNQAPPVTPPFSEVLDAAAGRPGQSCTQVGINMFDREEGSPSAPQAGPPPFSPAAPDAPVYNSLCHEVNVITISDPANAVSILGSTYVNGAGGAALAVNAEPFGTAGWLKLDLYDYAFSNGQVHETRPSLEGHVFKGLPVTGFAAEKLINGDVNNQTANYAGAYHHRIERRISL